MTQLILDHPLYPLLQMVFQKCELATSSPRDAQAETICSSDSFSEDIRNFIHESRLRNLPLTTGVQDVDKFMLKSIEVLRIHLLELEKVHQLCDNFCQRYINCLKGKLPIDLVVDDGSSRDSASRNGNQQQNNNTSGNNPTNNSAQNGQQSAGNAAANQNNTNSTNNNSTGNPNQSQNETNNNTGGAATNGASGTINNGDLAANPNGHYHQDASTSAATNGYPGAYGSYGVCASGYPGAADHRMNPYAAHHAYAASASAVGMHSAPHYQATGGSLKQLDHNSSTNSNNSSTTPTTPTATANNNNSITNNANHHRESTTSSVSSIKLEHGANGGQYGTETNNASAGSDRQQLHDDVRSPTGSTGSGDGTECEDDDNRRRQQKKRGIFPKAATNIMRAWLFQHLNHPYPSEDQKKQLAEETGLTILQVNNWFINARRRIVQPMIDQSNRSSGMAGPAFSPDAGMGYMLDSSQPFRSLPGVDSSGMGPLASHAAMTSAMGAYSAASAQHLSQYGRSQQQHAAMLGLPTSTTAPHMMGAHPTLPPHDYY